MGTIVDFIMQQPLSEVDVNEDPILVMTCGHALTMTTLDGMMEMSQYYEEQTDKTTGDVRYVAKKDLPGEEIPQVPCPLCRAPIVELLRYGRRIKFGQLSMRLKKHQLLQDKRMRDARRTLEVDQARIAQMRNEFLHAIGMIPDEPCPEPPKAELRRLGTFARKDDRFPQTPLMAITKTYGIPQKHEEEWTKLIKSATARLQAFKEINTEAFRSPSKRLFDAAVSHLFRVKTTPTFDVSSNTVTHPSMPRKDATASDVIEACILECGLPRNGHGGSAYVDSLHECANVLVLILAQAWAVVNKMGATSGWYWFVEDLLQCTLVHADKLRDAAISGKYERQNAYSRVIRMDVICKMTQLMGRKFLPAEENEKKEKLKKVDELTEQFLADLKVLWEDCPRGIKDECIERATEMEEKMTVAIKVARDETRYIPLTQDEKVMLFRTVSDTLGGSGHWYRCPNGHTYVIGECGRAMQAAVCPECGAQVGGGDHRLFGDNTLDTEFEAMH
ncbi:hypothetical protein BGZ65_005598 [Modicella reniformis]|uniref:RZ-type domain-containing protein n=1 Tax=Modicella reniformis TaxID=1440133 RepID=A0A9P6LTS9_9FUNG|nr:hypothetical protein BGZ65_005598 [Modicella reniformis]